MQAEHRALLRHVLVHINFIEGQLEQLTTESEAVLTPFTEPVAWLETIPCIGHTAAVTSIAEIGTDMTRFPSAKHLAWWAGVCPGNRQSAGKRLGGRTTGGNPWLRAILGEVAWSIAHTASSYQLSRRAVSPLCAAQWEAQSHCGGLPLAARHHLPYASHPERLLRPGPGLLRVAGERATPTSLRATPRAARVCSHFELAADRLRVIQRIFRGMLTPMGTVDAEQQ